MTEFMERLGRTIEKSREHAEAAEADQRRKAEEFGKSLLTPLVEKPGEVEMFDGQLRRVVDSSRVGWWRFHEHYDRSGYCDNPGRGY